MHSGPGTSCIGQEPQVCAVHSGPGRWVQRKAQEPHHRWGLGPEALEHPQNTWANPHFPVCSFLNSQRGEHPALQGAVWPHQEGTGLF